MATVTISVSDELKKKMEKFGELNWSAVARKAFEQRIALLEKMDKLLENSKFTEEDAIEMGRKVRRGISRRLREAAKSNK